MSFILDTFPGRHSTPLVLKESSASILILDNNFSCHYWEVLFEFNWTFKGLQRDDFIRSGNVKTRKRRCLLELGMSVLLVTVFELTIYCSRLVSEEGTIILSCIILLLKLSPEIVNKIVTEPLGGTATIDLEEVNETSSSFV